MKIDPRNKEVMKKLFFYKGKMSFELEMDRAALEAFTEALKLDEENVEIFMYRAKCFFKLSIFDDVVIDLLEVDRLDKHNVHYQQKQELRKLVGKFYIPKTNYDFLEIQKLATVQQISQSFASLKLLNKINMAKAVTVADKRKLEFKFRRIENAHKILSDQKLKQKYDKQLMRDEASLESAEQRRECWGDCNVHLGSCCRNIADAVKKNLFIILSFFCAAAVAVVVWNILGYWIFLPIFQVALVACCYSCG